jgi:hypothetical protein
MYICITHPEVQIPPKWAQPPASPASHSHPPTSLPDVESPQSCNAQEVLGFREIWKFDTQHVILSNLTPNSRPLQNLTPGAWISSKRGTHPIFYHIPCSWHSLMWRDENTPSHLFFFPGSLTKAIERSKKTSPSVAPVPSRPASYANRGKIQPRRAPAASKLRRRGRAPPRRGKLQPQVSSAPRGKLPPWQHGGERWRAEESCVGAEEQWR